MPGHSFYKTHWVTIDYGRLDQYQRMFAWNPDPAALYESADIRPGHIVAEFGCGPGHTAIQIADWVGANGHVHALDVNHAFVSQTEKTRPTAALQTGLRRTNPMDRCCHSPTPRSTA
jgi:ubiquinone/menaquinone biosynthesis C-methylase UbiE